MQDVNQKIRDNPKFQQLVAERNKFALVLTILMMLAYYGFILLVAFDKPLLASKIGPGVTSLGVPIGLGVILFTIVVTAIYVKRANGEFDTRTHEIIQEASK